MNSSHTKTQYTHKRVDVKNEVAAHPSTSSPTRSPIYSTSSLNSTQATAGCAASGATQSTTAGAALLRFDALLLKCEKAHAAGLAFDELRELSRLYRQHTARLARERARSEDPDSIRSLNTLCVRAYSVLYSPSAKATDAERNFLTRLRSALGKTWRVQIAAWLLLLAGALVGGMLAHNEPDAVYALMPEMLGYSAGSLDRLIESPQARAEFLERKETSHTQNFLFGSWLFANNTKVGLLAFATGLLAGIPTILLQLYNGIVLGALSAVFLQDPWPVDYLAWILPHGIPELAAIVFCVAGGLLLGLAISSPGPHGRKRALREALDPALFLLAAAVPLFFLAAWIESFVRESALGLAPRFAIAALNFAFIAVSLYLARRYTTKRKITADWIFAPTGKF